MNKRKNRQGVRRAEPSPLSSHPPRGGEAGLLISQHEGPLPPPETLEKYEQVLTGLAERIVKMSENSLEHTQKIQLMQIRHTTLTNWFGILVAAGVAVAVLVVAVMLLSMGEIVPGTIAVGLELTYLVILFLVDRLLIRRRR